MRDAAVGFQCPECVAEGAKSTRSGRTAYGGLRPTNASITSGVIIGDQRRGLAGDRRHRRVRQPDLRLARAAPRRPVCRSGGGYYPNVPTRRLPGDRRRLTGSPGVADGAYWQLLTNAFIHVEVWHIAFNMLAIWILGPSSSWLIGRTRFLALYLLSALAASALVYWAAGETSPPRCVRRGVRADGRPAGGRAQGARRRARDPGLDRDQLRLSRSWCPASPGRDTSAASWAAC